MSLGLWLIWLTVVLTYADNYLEFSTTMSTCKVCELLQRVFFSFLFSLKQCCYILKQRKRTEVDPDIP